MKSAAVIVAEDGRRVATWISGTKSGLDQKALKLAHPDLVEKFHRVSEFRTFKIIERRA